MKSKKTQLEISAGGIVYKRQKGEVKILLIKDSYGRWALPKGKIEKKEKPEEAALREIKEETGIGALKIKEGLGQIRYFYQLEGQRFFKIVYNFLIETEEEKLKPCWEIQDARWFSPEEALNKIAYKNTKEILKKAIDKLKLIKK